MFIVHIMQTDSIGEFLNNKHNKNCSYYLNTSHNAGIHASLELESQILKTKV